LVLSRQKVLGSLPWILLVGLVGFVGSQILAAAFPQLLPLRCAAGGVAAPSGTKILVCISSPEHYAQVPKPVPDPCLLQEGEWSRAELPMGAV